MATTNRAGPRQSQEQGASSKSPAWVGALHCSSLPLAGSCITNGAARTWADTHMAYWHDRQQCNPACHNTPIFLLSTLSCSKRLNYNHSCIHKMTINLIMLGQMQMRKIRLRYHYLLLPYTINRNSWHSKANVYDLVLP